MAARPLYGVPDEVLLNKRREAAEEYLRRKSTTSTGNEAGNFAFQIIANTLAVINEINAELRARGHPEAPADATIPISFAQVGFSS